MGRLVAYALLVQADVCLNINQNEVQDTRYVTEGELKQMLNNPDVEFSPWFILICRSMLSKWWKHINSGSEKEILEDTTIQRMV